MRIKESDLARVVVAELQRQGYKVYEEVSTGYAGRRADLVGVRGPVLAVVECKVTLSLQLLGQLLAWRGQANLIIGAWSGGRISEAARDCCKRHGFGLWSAGFTEVHEAVAPRLQRRIGARLRNALRPEMQSPDYAKAGTQGGYWTPFRETCRALSVVVARTPGIELRAALGEVRHHYASERSALSAVPMAIRQGLIPGVRLECVGRRLQLFPNAQGLARPGPA